MPWFKYGSADYPYPNRAAYRFYSRHASWCAVTWPELIWSAVTVGRARRDLFQYPPFSFYEMIYRSAIVYANLKADPNMLNPSAIVYVHPKADRNMYEVVDHTPSTLVKTKAYVRLDPSEKSAISYFLGLAFAKLLSDRVLATPWLMHLDVYGNEFSVEMWPGRARPDLFGRDVNGNWVVCEAKGRTGPYNERAFRTAKAQTSYVRTISGVAPKARVASEVFFSRDMLTVRIEDPPEVSRHAWDISISDEKFFKAYYAPFTELLSSAGDTQNTLEIGDSKFQVVTIEHADLQIGLSVEVMSLLKRRNFDGIFDFSRSVVNSQDSQAPELAAQTVGRDGVLVILGRTWADKVMAAEPEERSHEIGAKPVEGKGN